MISYINGNVKHFQKEKSIGNTYAQKTFYLREFKSIGLQNYLFFWNGFVKLEETKKALKNQGFFWRYLFYPPLMAEKERLV